MKMFRRLQHSLHILSCTVVVTRVADREMIFMLAVTVPPCGQCNIAIGSRCTIFPGGSTWFSQYTATFPGLALRRDYIGKPSDWAEDVWSLRAHCCSSRNGSSQKDPLVVKCQLDWSKLLDTSRRSQCSSLLPEASVCAAVCGYWLDLRGSRELFV